MNRKEFVRNISLLGVGISLTPLAFSKQTKLAAQYNLPAASVHIPHGNFASSGLIVLHVSEMNIEVTIQKFMKNGITDSEEDLTVYTFHRKNEMLSVSAIGNALSSMGEIQGLRFQKAGHSLQLSDKNYVADLSPSQNTLVIRSHSY